MGCDIHIYAEKLVRGKWMCISPLVYNPYSDPCYEERELDEIDVGRDYNLFGFLAKVRYEQPDGFEPRGFPGDASHEVKRIYKGWGSDAHSSSFLTLEELRDAFKGNVIVNGMMPPDRKRRLLRSIAAGKPDWKLLYPHAAWATGWEEFKVEVPKEYEFKCFFDRVMEGLLSKHTYNEEKKEHIPSEVRIVFWFDN